MMDAASILCVRRRPWRVAERPGQQIACHPIQRLVDKRREVALDLARLGFFSSVVSAARMPSAITRGGSRFPRPWPPRLRWPARASCSPSGGGLGRGLDGLLRGLCSRSGLRCFRGLACGGNGARAGCGFGWAVVDMGRRRPDECRLARTSGRFAMPRGRRKRMRVRGRGRTWLSAYVLRVRIHRRQRRWREMSRWRTPPGSRGSVRP